MNTPRLCYAVSTALIPLPIVALVTRDLLMQTSSDAYLSPPEIFYTLSAFAMTALLTTMALGSLIALAHRNPTNRRRLLTRGFAGVVCAGLVLYVMLCLMRWYLPLSTT